MGHVSYVGFVIYRYATVRTRLCLYKKKKKSVVTSIATLPQANIYPSTQKYVTKVKYAGHDILWVVSVSRCRLIKSN